MATKTQIAEEYKYEIVGDVEEAESCANNAGYYIPESFEVDVQLAINYTDERDIRELLNDVRSAQEAADEAYGSAREFADQAERSVNSLAAAVEMLENLLNDLEGADEDIAVGDTVTIAPTNYCYKVLALDPPHAWVKRTDTIGLNTPFTAEISHLTVEEKAEG